MKNLTIALGLYFGAAGLFPAQADPITKGLSLWLKADNGLATDGSSWTDQSGNGHNATAIAGQAPTYIPSALKGLPAAHFNGAQAMSISGQVLTSQKFTIIAVATDETTSAQTNYREIVSNWNAPTGGQSIFLGTVWKKPADKFLDRIRFTDTIGGAGQGQQGVGQINKPKNVFILSGVSGKANAFVYVGTKRQYALGAPLDARDLTAGWYLGEQGTLNSEFWTGDIAEVLVYNRALTKQELGQDISYLELKWQ